MQDYKTILSEYDMILDFVYMNEKHLYTEFLLLNIVKLGIPFNEIFFRKAIHKTLKMELKIIRTNFQKAILYLKVENDKRKGYLATNYLKSKIVRQVYKSIRNEDHNIEYYENCINHCNILLLIIKFIK